MLFSSTIRLAPLAALCERMSMTLAAGIDLRAAWQKEAERARGRTQVVYRQIANELGEGDSIGAALRNTGDFFPPLFVELVALGEHAGRLPEMLRQLNQQYRMQIEARRAFKLAITWPAIQLVAAIMIVGFLIWVMGVIGNSAGGEPFDPLGVGLVGTRGATTYFAIICGVIAFGWALIYTVTTQLRLQRTVVRVVRWIPLLGGAAKSMIAARFCWSLGLGLQSGMEVIRAVRLAIRAAGDPGLTGAEPQILDSLGKGTSVCEALSDRPGISRELLQEIDVGEASGELPETLLRQADRYNTQTKTRLNLLAAVGSFLCWAFVAGLIILVIFRLFFTFILGPYREFGLI